jgi:hypothetical protein
MRALCQRLWRRDGVYVYRRSEEEMPARREEVEHAKEEGIIFKMLTNPTQILGVEHKFVRGMEVVDMELGEPDAYGQRRPVEKRVRSICWMSTVSSCRSAPPPIAVRHTTTGLETNRHGCIVTEEETGLTSREGVYAGGVCGHWKRPPSSWPWVRARTPHMPSMSTSGTNNVFPHKFAPLDCIQSSGGILKPQEENFTIWRWRSRTPP